MAECREAWEPVEEKILSGLVAVLETEFYKDVIDVYMAPMLPSISSPILISIRYEPDEFIDILTHELIHNLLADGTRRTPLPSEVFPEEDDPLVQVHIIVHAVAKHVFLDVFGEPYRLQRELQSAQGSPAYARAWQIVEQRDYRHIITTFKSHYPKS